LLGILDLGDVLYYSLGLIFSEPLVSEPDNFLSGGASLLDGDLLVSLLTNPIAYFDILFYLYLTEM
jgi:hypothetical protein